MDRVRIDLENGRMADTMWGEWTGGAVILAVCVLAVLAGAVRKKMEWLLNVFMRSILGTIAIYFINSALAGAGVDLGIGINALTVLTSGILGFPGLLALYGIGIYKIL